MFIYATDMLGCIGVLTGGWLSYLCSQNKKVIKDLDLDLDMGAKTRSVACSYMNRGKFLEPFRVQFSHILSRGNCW